MTDRDHPDWQPVAYDDPGCEYDPDDQHAARHPGWVEGCPGCLDRAEGLASQRHRVRLEPGDTGPTDERWAQP